MFLHGKLSIKLNFSLWFGPPIGCTMLRVQGSSVLLQGTKSEAEAVSWVLLHPREQQHRLLSLLDILVTCSWGKREETLFTKENNGAADFSLVLLICENVQE